MTIVLCTKGYPGNYKKKIEIENLEKLQLTKNQCIYHAGTTIENNQLLSNGGRVLNITAIGKNFFKIRNEIIKILKKLNWKAGFFRRDIGWKVISRNANN